jgi:DNA-binding XRE family transcriptional regulator
MSTAARIADARRALPNYTQRDLEGATGISQATFHRIEKGSREPKMNELISIAWALGCSLGELTGNSAVAENLVCSARTTGNGAMAAMRAELTHYFELDAYLDEQGIPQPA